MDNRSSSGIVDMTAVILDNDDREIEDEQPEGNKWLLDFLKIELWP